MSAAVNEIVPASSGGPARPDRRRLEPFEESMAPAISAWIQSDEEMRWIAPYTPPPASPENVLSWQRERQAAFVFEDASGAPRAYGELVRAALEPRELWIAHVIVDPARRGEGLGRSFTEALADRAFDGYHASHVYLSVFQDNPVARACYERCGFRHFKTRPVRTFAGETGFSMLDMRIDRFSWVARRWLKRLEEACEGADWRAHYDAYCAPRHESDPALREKLGLILDAFGGGPDARFEAADFGSGPGIAAEAIAARFPKARVTAFDADPLALLLGRMALRATYADRIAFEPADLRGSVWMDGRHGAFGLAVSTLATHWMSRRSLRDFYSALATVLAPGGIFANADHVPEESGRGRSAAARILRAMSPVKRGKSRTAGAWTKFWTDLKEQLGIVDLCDEMQADLNVYEGFEPGFSRRIHFDALQDAGLGAVEEVWRRKGDAVLVARKDAE
jgi:RimJ/RimL family protein N-acetyltransferase